MAKQKSKYLSRLLKNQPEDLTVETSDIPDIEDIDVAVTNAPEFELPLAELQIPEVEDNITLLLVPEKFRPAYIRAGRFNTHAEIVMIDENGFAHCRTPNAVTALIYKGFTIVKEPQ